MTTIEDIAPPEPPADTDAIANIMNMLRRRRLLMLAIVAVVTALAGLVATHLKPAYRVELNLLLDPHNLQVNDIQTLAGQVGSVDSNLIRNEIAILWSEDLAREVVSSLHLQDLPEFQPTTSRFFKPLSPDDPIDRAITASRDAVKRTLHLDRTPPALSEEARLNTVVARYLTMLTVVNDGRSYVMTLRVTASDPALAVKIVTAHAHAYLDRQLALKKASVTEADATAGAELVGLAQKLRESEEALQQFRSSAAIIGSDAPTLMTQQMTDVSSKLTVVRSEVVERQSRIQALQSLLTDPGSDVGMVIASPAYDRLRAKEQDLQQRQAELSAKFSDGYPELAEIRLQLASTRGQMRTEINRIVKSAQADLSATKLQQDQLEAALNTVKSGVQHQENAAPNLHFLEAEVEANKTVYTAFLTKVRQLSAQATLQQPDGRIIGEAIQPSTPSFPPGPAVIIGGGFVGASGLAVALALLLGFASSGFESLGQVERACDAPGLGIVPLMRRRDRRSGLPHKILALPRSHYAERVRLIRNSVALTVSNSVALTVSAERRGQVILMTSALPMEGKTMSAISIAMSFASSGRRTVLVDADLRRPAIGRILEGNPACPGLRDHIDGDASLDQIIQIHESSGLNYIAASQAAKPTEKVKDFDVPPEFFDMLRSRYDYIIIDSPPVVAVSDALWLAQEADSTIFLVRWRQTPRSAVRAAIRRLRNTGALVSGVLLTFVDIKKSGSVTPSDFDYYFRSVNRYYGPH